MSSDVLMTNRALTHEVRKHLHPRFRNALLSFRGPRFTGIENETDVLRAHYVVL